MTSVRGLVEPWRWKWRCLAVASGLALAGAGGCGDQGADRETTARSVTRTASRGGVEVTLTATPSTLEFEQHVRLTLEIVAEDGVTILDNDYESMLSRGDRRYEYRVARADADIGTPTVDGKVRRDFGFEVEFFLPGAYDLPGARVSFLASSSADDSVEEVSAADAPVGVQTVETEPLTLVVRPPPGPPPSQAELRSITRLDPIELPTVWSARWWIAPLMILIVVLAAVLMLRRPPRPPPGVDLRAAHHEWARQQIAALVADELVQKGRVQEFYYRISGIVRGYIERRFDIRAPEMTTEEFLASAASDRRFRTVVTEQLDRFLSACDLVKYACRKPRSEESDTVLRTAGDFVERTRGCEWSTDEQRAETSVQLRAG